MFFKRVVSTVVIVLFVSDFVCATAIGQTQLPPGAVPSIDANVVAASLLQKGRRLAESGQAAAALEVLCNLVSLKPDDAEGYFWKGFAEQALNDNEAAIASYQRAITLTANSGMECAEMHANLGNALIKLDRQTEAIAEYKRAIAIDPTLAEAQFDLGNALKISGDSAGAAECFENCTRLRFNPRRQQPAR